jgi:hypothetical protein
MESPENIKYQQPLIKGILPLCELGGTHTNSQCENFVATLALG